MKRRDGRIFGFAMVLLVLTALLVLPAVVAMAGCAPEMAAGVLCAALPMGFVLRKADGTEGGGGDFEAKVLGGVEKLQKSIEAHETALKAAGSDILAIKEAQNKLQAAQDEFRKGQMKAKQSYRPAGPGRVGDECARMLGGIALMAAIKQERAQLNDQTEGLIKDIFGMEAKSALTTSNIPLPVGYAGEVVELMAQYGHARQYGTVFPLGNGIVNLPRIKTSPAFGLIAASATVTEVSPETEWVTFTAQKFGGLVRLPSEIEEDSLFAIGQFLARYAAREMAKAEDTQFFMSTGAGSGVNGSAKGITVLVTDNSKTTGMAAGAGKTAYSDTTLAVARAVRALPDEPAIANGSYYFHRTFEQFLSNLNTAGDKPYLAARGGESATFDGFPVRWVNVLPAYSTSANASKVYGLFGDLSYMYLGVRKGMEFATSKEAGFTTDEILVRALERMTVGLMATGAMAGLKTPAN